MSQRHGRFWSIGYNAIGYTGDIKKPNWFTNVRRFAGLSTAGKTMAVAYLATVYNRVYPVTFAIASAVQHGVNVLNRGGENADRDHDLRVAVSVSGTNMTLTTIAGNRCTGIWQVYTM